MESSKLPVKSCPKKTYTYSLEGSYKAAVAGVVFEVIISICIFAVDSWRTPLIPVLILSLPLVAILWMNARYKNARISFSPEGLTLCGALNLKDGFKNDFRREDFIKEEHFKWEQIQRLGYTRGPRHPSFFVHTPVGWRNLLFPYQVFLQRHIHHRQPTAFHWIFRL